MFKITDEEKFAVLDDTILFIWKNAESMPLETVNGLIQELIKVFKK